MYKIILIVFVVFLFDKEVSARDFIVNDIKVLHKMIQKVKSGDVIIMKDGVWSDVNIIFRAEGNETDPIILRAEHKGGVIISGNSSLGIRGNYLTVDGLVFQNGQPSGQNLILFGEEGKPANHCRLTNTQIIDFNEQNLSRRHDWVSIYGGKYNRVDHCHFTQMKNRGVTLIVWILDGDPPNYHRIDHNEFSHRMYGERRNGYETIRIGDSIHNLQNSRTIVEDNLFLQCDGEIEIISNKSSENYFIHNTFKNSKGTLTLRHGNRSLVEDNFFFGEGNTSAGGIRIVGEGHRIINNYFEGVGPWPARAAISFINGMPNPPLYEYSQVKDCNITHNKLINTKYSIAIGTNYKNGKYSLPPTNIIFNNNLIVGSKSFLIQYLGNIKPEIKYRNNITFGAKLGIEIENGIRLLNPKLTKDKNSGLWISHIEGDFNESEILPVQNQDVGPI